MKTLERFIETTRRHVRAPRTSGLVNPAAPDDSVYATQLVNRVVSVLDILRAGDRVYQSVLREQPSKAAVLADQMSEAFGAYAALIVEVLHIIDQLPPSNRPAADRLAELQTCRSEAVEMQSVMLGEADFARGDRGTPWEVVRQRLGI